LVIRIDAVISISAAALAQSNSAVALLAEGPGWLPPVVISLISKLAIMNGLVVRDPAFFTG
jgi:hypothetical protein